MTLDDTWRSLEKINLDHRALLERAYRNNPGPTHSELVYRGLWTIAAQLKIDYAIGRLHEGAPRV